MHNDVETERKVVRNELAQDQPHPAGAHAGTRRRLRQLVSPPARLGSSRVSTPSEQTRGALPLPFASRSRCPARRRSGAVGQRRLFAEKENLIKPGAAEFRPATFGHKGQVYDGWETRQAPRRDGRFARLRRSSGSACPASSAGVVVDTAWFTGNYPPEISVEAAFVVGYPPAEELVDKVTWTTIVERRAVNGDTRNPFKVDSPKRWSHVRLAIYPDGGVARSPGARRRPAGSATSPRACRWIWRRWRTAAESRRCSNMFYGSPNNLLLPGTARTMGDGLGDLPAARHRKRLGAGASGRTGRADRGRVGHVVLHRQRPRVGAGCAAATGTASGSTCCPDRAAARHPAPVPGRFRSARHRRPPRHPSRRRHGAAAIVRAADPGGSAAGDRALGGQRLIPSQRLPSTVGAVHCAGPTSVPEAHTRAAEHEFQDARA